MANFLNGVNIQVPGTYAFLTATQSRPVDVQPFRTCYLVGRGSLSNAPKNLPTRVSSLADFTNVFGTSGSTTSVDLFFQNSQGYGNLYFVNVAIPVQYTLVITAVTAGTYTITINDVIKTLTVVGGATTAGIAADVIDLINNDLVLNKETIASQGLTASTVTIKSKKPANTLLVSSDATLISTLAISTPTTPSFSDYVYTIANSFDPESEAGFVCCPEAFKSFNASGRLSVMNAMESLASANRFQWVALIDPGTPVEITNSDRAVTEAKTYVSAQGHSSYYYPYLIDLTDNLVPPSTAIAGLALYRYVQDGFAEPPAGTRYQLRGVKDVAYQTNWSEQNIANPEGVNIILNKPKYGVVCWGARTLSTDTNLKFISTRVILNIVINSLYAGFDDDIFTSIGGAATVLGNVQRKAESLLDTFWRSGLLYGSSTTEAYEVLADASVQIPALLQQGLVNMFVWVVPATILERLVINIKQVAIGDLQIVVANDIGAIQETAGTGDTEDPAVAA